MEEETRELFFFLPFFFGGGGGGGVGYSVPRSSFPDSLTERRLDLARSIKERREKTGGGGGGDSRESFRYESYMLLPFLLCFSLPLLFADSC